MKVIDLLNKIANEEEVPLIKYRDKILHWNKETDRFEDKNGMNTLYEMDFSELNDEVEIIEEDKKIEKIDVALLGQCDNWIHKYNAEKKEFENLKEEINPYIIDTIRENTISFQKKINEIIDYLDEKE